MGLDPKLAAAATLHRARGSGAGTCSPDEATHQLQLASVLLDGGYEGVATLADALAGGDLGLGTVDGLDGELVVVDGEPWRIDWRGEAELMAPDARTPFAVVGTLNDPQRTRLRDVSWDATMAAIADLADAADSVIAVRLEGQFEDVLLRSVRPQTRPYRPFAEVVESDEVRWEHRTFFGVFVGFVFPDLSPGATIPGLHLHGLDRLRTTGGHCYELRVTDAELSVGTSHDVVVQLPDRTMTDLLETPEPMRRAQRALLREGSATVEQLAQLLAASVSDTARRLDWLSDRGFVDHSAGDDGVTLWRVTMRSTSGRPSAALDALLDRLSVEY
jgi:acetolactate decarboxylase